MQLLDFIHDDESFARLDVHAGNGTDSKKDAVDIIVWGKQVLDHGIVVTVDISDTFKLKPAKFLEYIRLSHLPCPKQNKRLPVSSVLPGYQLLHD